MHIQVRSDNGDLLGDLHISREMQSAQIMQADIEILEQLVQIARSQNVPTVTIIVPVDGVEQLTSLGWLVADTQVVMYRKR